MEIGYRNNIDDWIAAQIFVLEQITPLKKQDRKSFIGYLFFFAMIGGITYLTTQKNALWHALCFFIFCIIIFFFILNKTNKRRLIYMRLRVAYQQQFDANKDEIIRWQVEPEQVTIRDSRKEIRFSWVNVEKIIICSQYLFVYLGPVESMILPSRNVCEGAYDAFTQYFISCYKNNAVQRNTSAEVVQNKLAIDVGILKSQISWKQSFRRLTFTFLWFLVFLTGGLVLSFGLMVGAVFIAGITGFEPTNNRDFCVNMGKIFLISGCLIGGLGAILGFLGKLPGTGIKGTNNLA